MRGARKHRERGKARERQVASCFGTVRTPLSGGNSRITRSDTLHPRLYIETKERARHAVFALYDEVDQKAGAEAKTPVLALAETGRSGFLLVIHVDHLPVVAAELRREVNGT